jgi:hypothetical protein
MNPDWPLAKVSCRANARGGSSYGLSTPSMARDRVFPQRMSSTASGGRHSRARSPFTTIGRSMTIGYFTIPAMISASERPGLSSPAAFASFLCRSWRGAKPRCFEPSEFGLVGRRLQILDDARFHAARLEKRQGATRGVATRVVVDGDAHGQPLRRQIPGGLLPTGRLLSRQRFLARGDLGARRLRQMRAV